jgi:hypothetical protein
VVVVVVVVVTVVVVVVVQPTEAGIFMNNLEACEGKAYTGNNKPECYRSRILFCLFVCVCVCVCVLSSVSVICKAFNVRVV